MCGYLTSSWQQDISPRLAALRRRVQVAADAVAEMSVAQRALGNQWLRLQIWDAERRIMIKESVRRFHFESGSERVQF